MRQRPFWGRKFQELGLVVECSRSRVDGLIERVLINDPALREGLDLSQVSDVFWAMLGYEVRRLQTVPGDRTDCRQCAGGGGWRWL